MWAEVGQGLSQHCPSLGHHRLLFPPVGAAPPASAGMYRVALPCQEQSWCLAREGSGTGKATRGALAPELQGAARAPEPADLPQVSGLPGAIKGWGMAALPRLSQLCIPTAGGWRESV